MARHAVEGKEIQNFRGLVHAQAAEETQLHSFALALILGGKRGQVHTLFNRTSSIDRVNSSTGWPSASRFFKSSVVSGSFRNGRMTINTAAVGHPQGRVVRRIGIGVQRRTGVQIRCGYRLQHLTIRP